MVNKGREIEALGNHAISKSQKSVEKPKSKAKKSKDSRVKTFKKLYVYYSEDDGIFSVWQGKTSSKLLEKYWTFAYEITIESTGEMMSDIVARVAAGIEFGNDCDRFEVL